MHYFAVTYFEMAKGKFSGEKNLQGDNKLSEMIHHNFLGKKKKSNLGK